MEEEEKKHKLFDPVKAKAQIEVYKEIYKMDDKTKPSLKLTDGIHQEDKDKIEAYFKENTGDKQEEELTNEQLSYFDECK